MKGLVTKETVLQRRWGRKTRNFGTNFIRAQNVNSVTYLFTVKTASLSTDTKLSCIYLVEFPNENARGSVSRAIISITLESSRSRIKQ